MLNSFEKEKNIFIPKVFKVIEELQRFPQKRSKDIAKKYHLSKQELINTYNFISKDKSLQNLIRDYSCYPEFSRSVFEIFKEKDKLEKLINGETVYPTIVELHLGERCNLNCIMCFSKGIEYKKTSRPILKLKEIFDIFDEFKKIGVKEIWFSGGKEPLMSPYAINAIEKAEKMGFIIRLYSNGVLLDNDEKRKKILNVSQLRISLNAATSKTYDQIHFSSGKENQTENDIFGKVIKNLKDIIDLKKKYKSKVKIAVSSIVQPLNYHEIVKFVELGKKLGVDSIQFRAESVGKIQKFDSKQIDCINNQIEKIKKNINTGLYKNIEIEFRGLSSEELKVSKSISQFLPGLKRASLCRAGVFKRGINLYGEVYFCEHSMHPGNLINTIYINKKLGNIREKKFTDIIKQSKGKYPKTCKLCQAYGYGLNIILEKLSDDYKWGINLEDQPYFLKHE